MQIIKMKNSILIVCLFAYTAAIYAQNPRITAGNPRTETYLFQKGGDSVRFTILGTNDTLQETEYYRSGKTSSITWKKDSLYRFDLLGRLSKKLYSFGERGFTDDNSCSFFANGQVYQIKTDSKGFASEKTFTEDGLLWHSESTTPTATGSFTRKTDQLGRTIATYQWDSVFYKGDFAYRRRDTLYYPSGKVFKTKISLNNESLGQQFYDEKGILIKATPPDSLDLIIFKDNVDCYYGLKTQQGDTVVKPRFDRIKEFGTYFFAAYVGESVILLSPKGEPITSPAAHLSEVGELYATHNLLKNDNQDKNTRQFEHLENLDTASVYFTFTDGDKNGVMTNNLSVVMPPQYLSLTNGYLGDAQFFQFNEYKGDSLFRQGYLTREGKPIFGSAFKNVIHTKYKDYFTLNLVNSLRKFGESLQKERQNAAKYAKNPFVFDVYNTVGLGKSDESIVLPPKFIDIELLLKAELFITSLVKTNKETKTGKFYESIYNARTNRWLLDTLGFRIWNGNFYNTLFFSVEQVATKKCGIMDTAGNYVLPLAFDSIGIVDDSRGLFWVKKNGKYQIFEVNNGKPNLHKTLYDFLSPRNFDTRNVSAHEEITYFLAQRQQKWGLIDVQENILKPFDYDYASVPLGSSGDFFLVKNNQSAYFTLNSLPNEMPFRENNGGLKDYPLLNRGDRVFFANDTGKVMIPPQYKLLRGSSDGNFAFVLDDQERKKVVFYETGAVVDYPFTYKLKSATAKSRVMLVKDSMELGFGVVSTDGKLLMPCNNYGVALGDRETSTFFVKRDTPIINRYGKKRIELFDVNPDTLNAEDKGWLMYDAAGKLMDTVPFRFPIGFVNGIGVGMQNKGFHLYKADGTILQPYEKTAAVDVKTSEVDVKTSDKSKISPTLENKKDNYTEGSFSQGFNSIRRNTDLNFYALYYNQGMIPTLILTKNNGEIFVKSGRYDGISRFYGKYALVSARKNIGLIDSFGREVIPPQDLRTYTGHFIDSLEKEERHTQLLATQNKAFFDYENNRLPLGFENDQLNLHPDNLKINTEQRAALWNLMLEKCLAYTIATASDVQIPRSHFQENASYMSKTGFDNDVKQRYPIQIIVADKTIAFSLGENSYVNSELDYYNFYRRDNRWEELQLNDLLQIQGEKRQKINDLITKKVKALQDVQLDCSNASSFITQVENKWLLTKDGIDFCFVSDGSGSKQLVIISFTWAELKSFLKVKIY